MMAKKLVVILAVVMCLLVAGDLAVDAQSTAGPQVLSVVSQPGSESLGLDVYFVITDDQGQPVLDPNLEAATIQVVGSASAPAPASLGDPQSDIYVVLLLDTSGSMANTIDQVRQAAISGLHSLPPNARVSVIAFDADQRIINDFTGDLTEVRNRIQQVQVTPGGATCLYDAVWNAIDRLDLNAVQPQDRRAIILFTDGRDQRRADSNEACSMHNLQDVVEKAQRGSSVGVHTIGLCGTDCGNINRVELSNLAGDTNAFVAIGNQTELGAMFETIMEGLNAQLVARAQVFPSQGLGQAVLAVKPRDVNGFVTTMFQFLSDKNYSAPLPPAAVRISQVLYQPHDNIYQLAISLVNPQPIDRLVLNVEETEGGKTVVTDLQINLDGQDAIQTDFSAQNLQAGKTYTIKVQAVDADGFMLEASGDDTTCPKGDKTYLACKVFKHEPPVAPGCEFTIQSVTPDYARGVFVFDLAMPAQCGDVFYQGLLVERETSQKVQDIARSSLFATQGVNKLEIPMPPALLVLKKNQAPPEYVMSLDLETRDEKKTAQTFTFLASAPPRPSFFQQVTNGLRQNPYLLIAIFAFVIAVLAYRAYQNQRAQKTKEELRRPPVAYTQPLQRIEPARRLRLTVLKTPGQPPAREVVLEKFPYVIGRREGDLILPDKKMSGRHAQVTVSGNQFFIEDLSSMNHTFVVGEQLAPGQPTLLSSPVRVRFGPDTEVEFQAL